MRILDEKIDELQQMLIKMCAMVEESMDKTIRALLNRDMTLARSAIDLDVAIDDIEVRIEDKCVNIIATQQPMANDLRRLSSVLKIITDLERIGDYSVNIARIVLQMGDDPLFQPLIDTPKMAEKAKLMVRKSIDAWVADDVALAQETARMDEEVDRLYELVYTDLLSSLVERPERIKQTTQLLFIGRHLERIADHATNICERVIYVASGAREHY